MAKINTAYNLLASGYLFPEIGRRRKAFQERHPEAKIISLGIGNTTEPLAPKVIEGLHKGVSNLADVKTYTGYGDEQGDKRLREAIANELYQKRGADVRPDEIFVSDGAKPDSANIQQIFSLDNIIAVQDPAYPVYVDTNVASGRTGSFNDLTKQYDGIVYMPCNGGNGFFPDLPKGRVDLIYICSPNNPTGAVATKEQLRKFIDYAWENNAVIIFDAAYSEFIKDASLPKSIYQLKGAKECAIEINSFSKSAGFTGVRCGWTVVPTLLAAENAGPGELNRLWNRRSTTFFNGASNIVQEGALAALTEEGRKQSQETVDYYLGNAQLIKDGVTKLGFKVHGGENAPYIWMKTPNGMKSWEFFDKLLEEVNIVCTPGSGFGPSGEGYVRLSSFGHRENVEEAVQRLSRLKL